LRRTPRGTPSVEAYCPFGGLETLYRFPATGGFIRRVNQIATTCKVRFEPGKLLEAVREAPAARGAGPKAPAKEHGGGEIPPQGGK